MIDGIHVGLPVADYRKIDAANFSVLKHMKRSPAHAFERMTNPPASTAAQELGTLIHCYLLEPTRFGQAYIELPDLTKNLKTKDGGTPKNPTATAEYKQRLAEFGQAHMGQKFVEPEDMAICRGIAESIAKHTTAANLLTDDVLDSENWNAEVAVVWTDPETGVRCKGLLDYWCGPVVLDVKTCDDASPFAFARLVHQNGWHLQAAWYLLGLSWAGVPVGEGGKFLHLAVETSPPYGVAVYELDNVSLDQGLREIRLYLAAFAACKASGRWPAYPDCVQPLSIPRFGITKDGIE